MRKKTVTHNVQQTVSEEGTYKHEEGRGGLDTTHKQHKTTHYTPHKRSGDHSPKELPPLLDLMRFEGGQVGSALPNLRVILRSVDVVSRWLE